jgi:hypothetical protein
MANQAKLFSFRRDAFWTLNYLISRTHAQAVAIDQSNGNESSNWKDSEAIKLNETVG